MASYKVTLKGEGVNTTIDCPDEFLDGNRFCCISFLQRSIYCAAWVGCIPPTSILNTLRSGALCIL